MHSNRVQVRPAKFYLAAMFCISTGLLLFGQAPVVDAYQDQQQALRVFTVPAGGTATLTVRGFCLDYGKPFPTGPVTVKGVEDGRPRAALNYSIQKGYTDNNASQVQLAIWYLRDNTWRGEDHAVAQEIVDKASNSNIPSGAGTPINEAFTQGAITATAKFIPQTEDAFYGDGEVEVKNTGSAELKLYMPIGVIFTAPGGAGGFQDLLAYDLGVKSASAQGTPETAASAVPSITQQATAIPTLTAITTPTAFSAATSEPIELGTVLANITAVARPTGVGGPTRSDLPSAGNGDNAIIALTLLAVGIGLALTGLGMQLSRRRG